LDPPYPRSDHDALTKHDVEVWRTPEGVLSSEVVPEGVYVGEVVRNKNVRKARGRMRVSGQWIVWAAAGVEGLMRCGIGSFGVCVLRHTWDRACT
jgi:hypothetical protein